MKNESTPTDEEIRSYMNFDGLLEKRKIALQKNRLHNLLTWGIPAVMVIGLVSLYVINRHLNTLPVVEENRKQVDSSFSAQDLPTIKIDSIPAPKESKVFHENKPSFKDPQISSKESKKRGNVDTLKIESEYVQAEPLEGYAKLYEYFNSELKYPSKALKDSIQGVQTISFIINANGEAENITFTKSLGLPFEKEAARLVEQMPSWKPATLNGKPVPSQVSIPLTFQIEKIKK